MSNVDNGMIKEFKCLQGCGHALEINELSKFLDEKQMKKLNNIKTTREIERNPDAIICTNASCHTALYRKDPKQRRMDCHECEQSSCFKC